jgi:hypothetical protein
MTRTLDFLREFARRPGRVLSRDLLLDAIVGRRSVPFDRSVDVMVGRLRKKVEFDPKQPSVIQTVPGEGYRFNAPLYPCKPVPGAPSTSADALPPLPAPAPAVAAWRSRWAPAIAAALVAALLSAGAYGWRSLALWHASPRRAPAPGPRRSCTHLANYLMYYFNLSS